MGKGPFTTVEAAIPAEVAGRSATYTPAGEGAAMFVLSGDLSRVKPLVIKNMMAVPWD
jgi:hypothetical protein